jgi:hypothetical protein
LIQVVVLQWTQPSTKDKPLTWKRFAILLLLLIIIPLVPVGLSQIFGGLLAWVENAAFLGVFLYVASNLLTLANPLMSINRNNVGGAIIDVYISMVALLTFDIVVNIVNIFQLLLSTKRQSDAI